jgi:PKD repeat protein
MDIQNSAMQRKFFAMQRDSLDISLGKPMDCHSWVLPFLISFILLSFSFCTKASAQENWWDNHFSFRRPVDVNWDSEHGNGNDVAEAQFYSAGHVDPQRNDVRMSTDTGVPIASRVLFAGPGDSVRVAFALSPRVRKYFVYFGNPNPAELPRNLASWTSHAGLLLETRHFNGGAADSFAALEAAWDHGGDFFGRTLVDRPFLGHNPFGDARPTISRYTGQFAAPVDGDYIFAIAGDRTALAIDGSPIVYSPGVVGDTRYRNTLNLKRGKHDILIYQIFDGGESRLSIGWKRPDVQKFDVIGRDVLGLVSRGSPGAMTEFSKRLTADFAMDFLGECIYNDHYSQRYRFTAQIPPQPPGAPSAQNSVQWDFGDGITSEERAVEHVYLLDGIYPVKLTVKVGAYSDTQTSRIVVSRDYEHIDSPLEDPAEVHSHIVARYDGTKMPVSWLPWAALLHAKAENQNAMLAAAAQIAAEKTHIDSVWAVDVLKQETVNLIGGAQSDRILAIWDSVPMDSTLQPQAAMYESQLLLWWRGDFEKALARLEPLATSRPRNGNLQRQYAQALLLNGKLEQARRILTGLPVSGEARRQVAMSGAMARSIEAFIAEGDWQSGEDAWETWQTRFPATYLEGYSALLQVRLMELKPLPAAAAKIAQAFAMSVPQSPYSPQLLDRASKLLATLDSAKSKELRQTLKQRYPEDPLSQD